MIFENSIQTIIEKFFTLTLVDEVQNININALDYLAAICLFPTSYPIMHLFTIPAVFFPHTEQKYLTYDVDDKLTNIDSNKIAVVFGGSITNAIDIYNVATQSKWMHNEKIVPHDAKIVFAGYEGMPEDYNQEKIRDFISQTIDEIYEQFPENQIVACSGHSMGGLMATEMHLQLQERMNEDEIKSLEKQGYNILTIDRSFSNFDYRLFNYNFYRFVSEQLESAIDPKYRVLLTALNDENLHISNETLHILQQWSETSLVNPIFSTDPAVQVRVEKYIDQNNVNMIFAKYDKTISFDSQQDLLRSVLALPKKESVNEQKFFMIDVDDSDVQMNPHQLPLFLAREAVLDELLDDFHFDYYDYCVRFPYPKETTIQSFIEHYIDLYELYEQGLIK